MSYAYEGRALHMIYVMAGLTTSEEENIYLYYPLPSSQVCYLKMDIHNSEVKISISEFIDTAPVYKNLGCLSRLALH